MNEAEQTLTKLIEIVLQELNSDDLYTLIGELDAEDDNRDFCERFELGEWFIEALDLNDMSILGILDHMASEEMKQERDDKLEEIIVAETQRGDY